MVFSLDETADVGQDAGTPVSDRYTSQGSHFTGQIDWVEVDIDAAAADEDHLISPEERLRLAMARQ
jgi:arylsulfatase